MAGHIIKGEVWELLKAQFGLEIAESIDFSILQGINECSEGAVKAGFLGGYMAGYKNGNEDGLDEHTLSDEEVETAAEEIFEMIREKLIENGDF